MVGFWGEISDFHGGLGWTHNFHVEFGSGSRVFIWDLKVDPGLMGMTAPKTIYVGLPLVGPKALTTEKKSIIIFYFYSAIGCECKLDINPLLFEIEIVNGI